MLSPLFIVILSYPLLIAGMSTTVKGEFGAADHDCSDVQLSKCIAPDNINKFKLISDEEELDNICGPNFNKRVRCIDNYTRNCLNKEQRSHFNKIYTESTMVIQEICADGGEYRKEFLKHSPCLKSNQAAHEKCAASYSQSLQDIKSNAEADVSTSTHITNLCCSLQEYLRCSKESVTRACGTDTANFAAGFLDRMVSGLVQNHCHNEQIEEGECRGKNTGSSLYRPSYYLVVSLLVLTRLLPTTL